MWRGRRSSFHSEITCAFQPLKIIKILAMRERELLIPAHRDTHFLCVLPLLCRICILVLLYLWVHEKPVWAVRPGEASEWGVWSFSVQNSRRTGSSWQVTETRLVQFEEKWQAEKTDALQTFEYSHIASPRKTQLLLNKKRHVKYYIISPHFT